MIFKRVFDIVFSIILIILLFPVFILVSLFIKINSKGRIIFKQNRLGKNGKEFKILKFRTMVENAESIGTGLDSYENDFRVTRIGKVLRNTSLDELPQLFNILIGDMSFIGPRPPVVYHPYPYSEYPEDAKKRFLVRPGVTGAAQVNGRNSLEWEEKFKFDIYYVENLNILLDIKIFFKTVIKVLKMEGSYDKKK
jgi:lipopolysaccharide/colanic/teichoic acid biosynthesis glycosyltransferase